MSLKPKRSGLGIKFWSKGNEKELDALSTTTPAQTVQAVQAVQAVPTVPTIPPTPLPYNPLLPTPPTTQAPRLRQPSTGNSLTALLEATEPFSTRPRRPTGVTPPLPRRLGSKESTTSLLPQTEPSVAVVPSPLILPESSSGPFLTRSRNPSGVTAQLPRRNGSDASISAILPPASNEVHPSFVPFPPRRSESGSVVWAPPLIPSKSDPSPATNTSSHAPSRSKPNSAVCLPLVVVNNHPSSAVNTPAVQSPPNPGAGAATPYLPPRQINSDVTRDCYELLEEILDDTLRDQAKMFVRKASTPRIGCKSTPRNESAAFGTATASLTSPPLSNQPQSPPAQNNEGSLGRNQRSNTYSGPDTLGTSHLISGSLISGPSDSHYRSLSTGFSPTTNTTQRSSPHSFTDPKRILRLPKVPNIAKRIRVPSHIFPFFTNQEEAEIEKKVKSKQHGCERHENCTDCTNTEFAYWELSIMPASIPAEERQKIIANNKSLRTIKNELDTLLENGMISDDTYATITDALPSETSLNSAARRNLSASTLTPTTDPNLVAAVDNMRLNQNSNEPPSYNTATNGPPALPGRTPTQPERPELDQATSLYPYEGAPEDCSFPVGETLSIYEYMNNEWAYGKNLRTGRQGLFPINYVTIKARNPRSSPYGNSNEKHNNVGFQGHYQQQSQGPPPPGPSNPYNSAVPPMQIAEQPVENKPGKGSEMGKKIGKKVGNAALFGAGATIGSNLVNSIF